MIVGEGELNNTNLLNNNDIYLVCSICNLPLQFQQKLVYHVLLFCNRIFDIYHPFLDIILLSSRGRARTFLADHSKNRAPFTLDDHRVLFPKLVEHETHNN
jgi:hypothetical protein